MRRTSRYGALVAALLLTANAAAAQLTADETHGEKELLFGTLRLSLEDAIALGIQNNLDVEIERHGPLIAFEDSQLAWGAYDPDFYAEAGYSYQTDPNSFSINTTPISKDQVKDGLVGVRGLMPYIGASLGLEYKGSRSLSNSTVQGLRPQYDTGLELTARLPLMRDLIWNDSWTLVKSSAIRHQASDENFRTALMETVRGIENAYWDLIAKNEDERVAAKSLETAKALLSQSQTEYEVGVKSKVDVYEAEAGKAERDFELIRAENQAHNAQDVLIDRVLGAKLTPGSELKIQPTDDPDDVIEYKINVEQATREAFIRRPELAARQRAVEERELQLTFAKNQRLPKLDILGTFGTTGKDGHAFPFNAPAGTAPTRTNDYSDASSQLFADRGGDNLTVRGVLTIPLGAIAGRHRVSKSQLELRRAVTELRRQEQQIIVEIRRAARGLESAQRGIVASEQRRVAAQEQLRAEEIRLEHGESTPFDVLQRERDLVEAERQKILALQLYRNSITDLHRFQGTTLEVRKISVSQAGPLR